jgi:RNA 3'-terminal phosphate cyclase (ATP)
VPFQDGPRRVGGHAGRELSPFPAARVGDGQFTVRVQPAKQLGRLELVHRGQIVAQRVRALVDNLPRHIAERECRTIVQETGWDESSFSIDEVKGSRGPGNVVMIELEAEHVTEVFTGSGGGMFRTMELSLHSTTHLEILRRFLEIDVQVDREDNGNCLVRFGQRSPCP